MKVGFDETFEEHREASDRLIDFTAELSAIEMEPLVPRAGSTATDRRSTSLDIDAVSSEKFNNETAKLVMKTDKALMEEQNSKHIVEEIVVLVPQVMEEKTETAKFIQQERVQNRTVEQIRGVLTPQIREEILEVTQPIPQE